jgi:hypothetical protein
MKNKLNKLIKVMLPILLLLLLSCATTPKILPPSPSKEFRANLGTIGVVSGHFQPEVRFWKPMTRGTGALHAAGQGALVAADMVGRGCSGMGCAGIIAAIPVGAIVGSIVGAVKGVPSQKMKETEDALNHYLLTINFQETMLERFLSVAREETRFPFVLFEVQGPNELDEEVTYSSLSARDIDTVLEISVRKCGLLRTEKSINPSLRLVMAVGIRLIRLTDGTVLHSRIFVDEWGDLLKFSDWAVNDAQPFREALDHAFQNLATEIMNAVSMIQTPPDPQISGDLQE